MTLAEKTRPVAVVLPIDPTTLVEVEPLDRGRLFNEADLDCWQRACVEEALRMVKQGSYSSEAGR